MKNYKTRIAQAKTSFELSCIWEEVRNAYWHKKKSAKKCMRNVLLKLQLGGNHYEQGRQSKTKIN